MRIYLSISRNSEIVPFDNIPILVGALHKWLGQNEYHNDISLYSFSWLKGGKCVPKGLNFPYGTEWFISSYETDFIKLIVSGIQTDPEIHYGLMVKGIMIKEDPSFKTMESFSVASPVFIKRRFNESIKHFIYKDKEADTYLTETLQTKLKKAGLDPENVEVNFKRDYHSPQTKLVNYNGISNKASICPVIIKGTPQQIAFAWNVGIGNSTGIGFGALN